MKGFKPKEGRTNRRLTAAAATGRRIFTGEKRSNDRHASTTDPEARLYRKGSGKAAKLCFIALR